MLPKSGEKQKAVEMRKKGHSYRDILKEVPVSKSSLSLWLRDLPLTKEEKQYLKKRRNANVSRGRIKAATANRTARILRDKELLLVARKEFDTFIKDPLFQIGVALYWAEGTKRSAMFQFSNSDSHMISMMILWLERFARVNRESVCARLYMHKPYAHENWEEFWIRETAIPVRNFKKTVYKPTGLLVKKRPSYKGCVRLEIPKSTALRKKLIFWISMLIEYYQGSEYTKEPFAPVVKRIS